MAQRTSIQYEFMVGVPINYNENLFTPFENAEERAINLAEFTDRVKGYVFTKHQITFNINYSSEKKEANSAKISLYNLDDDAVNYFKKNTRKNMPAFLSVGDNVQGLKEIFQGTVQKVEDEFSSETRVTTFTILDGGLNIKNAYSVRAWPRGTPYQQVARDLISDLKVPFGKICEIEGTFDTPKNFMAPTFKLMDSILGPLGFRTNIVKGKVNILPKGGKVEFKASYISKDTGLIGRVTEYTDESKSGSNAQDTESTGITFQCLIDGSIMPDETVYVKDREFDGAYKVVSCVINGDFEGDKWLMDIVATEAKGVAIVTV